MAPWSAWSSSRCGWAEPVSPCDWRGACSLPLSTGELLWDPLLSPWDFG